MARVRVLLAVVAACVLASVGALVHGAAEGAKLTAEAGQEVVRAQRFELVDSEGRVRAVLGMTAPAARISSPKIVLKNREGEEIVVEGAPVMGTGEAPGISLFDEAGRPRAPMWLGPDGTPYLEMMHADGSMIFAMPSEGRVEMLAR
jgi:hypothetical protein